MSHLLYFWFQIYTLHGNFPKIIGLRVFKDMISVGSQILWNPIVSCHKNIVPLVLKKLAARYFKKHLDVCKSYRIFTKVRIQKLKYALHGYLRRWSCMSPPEPCSLNVHKYQVRMWYNAIHMAWINDKY